MTRTQRIMETIKDELQRRQHEIDADDSLAKIDLIIRLDSQTDRPYMVTYRTESNRRLAKGA